MPVFDQPYGPVGKDKGNSHYRNEVIHYQVTLLQWWCFRLVFCGKALKFWNNVINVYSYGQVAFISSLLVTPTFIFPDLFFSVTRLGSGRTGISVPESLNVSYINNDGC